MVNHGIEIKHAAVEPALPCDARCTALPVGCAEVQTGKPQCAATAFFKIEPQVDTREQHAILQIFVTGVVHAHKPHGSRGLKAAGVEVDRKNLAEIAVSDPAAFTALVEVARAALPEDVNAPSGEAA